MSTEKPKIPSHHWDDVLRKEFAGESDRASVILAAALLDEALATLLKTHFVPTATADDSLFDGTGAPLSTFSARIEMTYRAGIVDAAMARNLHLIRRIRNDFAHKMIVSWIQWMLRGLAESVPKAGIGYVLPGNYQDIPPPKKTEPGEQQTPSAPSTP